MSVPFAPDPRPSPAVFPPAPPSSSGAQNQLVCNGCRTLLVYPQGAANVRCAVCSTITEAPREGTGMAQLICGGCRTLLMYARGATNVRCSCCHTINLATEASQMEHVTCGGCTLTLMYPSGAPLVKCAVCHFTTATGASSARTPLAPQQAPSNLTSSLPPSQQPPFPVQTVIIENPMTLDDNGKLVSSVAVGIKTGKK